MKRIVRVMMVAMMAATVWQGNLMAQDNTEGNTGTVVVSAAAGTVEGVANEAANIALAVVAVGTATWLMIRHHKKKNARKMAAVGLNQNQVMASAKPEPKPKSKKRIRSFFSKLQFGFTAAGQSLGRNNVGGTQSYGGSVCFNH